MNALDLVPGATGARLTVAAIAVAVLASAFFVWGEWRYAAGDKTGAGRVQQRWDAAARKASDLALRQSEANRETEQLRRRAQQGVVDGIRTENAALARHAGDLDGAAGRVRDRADQLAAQCGGGAGDPGPAGGSPTAASAGLVLADMYRGADGEAVDLAKAFDAARIAGLGCERAYDSLKP